VARRNTTFKITDVRELFLQAIANVSADNRTKAIQHPIGEEDEMWQLDLAIEVQVGLLIINLAEDTMLKISL
jgi:hypothetical protein